MTPREADKAIKSATPINVRSKGFNEHFALLVTSRNRWTVYGSYKPVGSEEWFTNGAFDRTDLEIV